MTKYLIQYSQMNFYLIVPTAICQIPFTRQIASKKGNCELKYVKNASSILGKQKIKFYMKGAVLYG
jgi:hypothetical protein